LKGITHSCTACRHVSAKPKPQLLGQLHADCLKPGSVFERVGVDYAGPVLLKSKPVHKPKLVKAYISVSVCLSVKLVHLEIVSDLTSEAFLGDLRRFISHRGNSHIMWSDNGTNFVGVANELKALFAFLREKETMKDLRTLLLTEHQLEIHP